MGKKKDSENVKGSESIVSKNSSATSVGYIDKKTPSASHPVGTTPYDIFLRCIQRAKNLVSFHSDDAVDPHQEHFCDAYRAAVVLTIAALDAYTRTVTIVKIQEKVRRKLKPKDSLFIYIKDIMSHDVLLESAINDRFFSEIENKVTEDFQKKSFQGERKITHYMEIAGYKNIIGIIAKKINLNEDNLKKKIGEFTERRHTIAHGGDYDINQIPYKENPITKEYAEGCIELISSFTKTLNEICFN